jgi:hypothetical protein
MAVQIVDRLGEQRRRVFALGRRRFVRAEKENLVHADVQGVRAEAIDYFVQ